MINYLKWTLKKVKAKHKRQRTHQRKRRHPKRKRATGESKIMLPILIYGSGTSSNSRC